MQRSWAVLHPEGMNAYSEDLRKKIVEAVERGMPKIEAAKTFGVGISSVKRYVAAAREGRSLAPKKRPGSKPKLDEGARRLLEADLEERPAATLPERGDFLRRVRGVEVSDSTVSRVLKRMGWTPWRSAPPTPRWHPCTLGLGEESERFARCHATGGRT